MATVRPVSGEGPGRPRDRGVPESDPQAAGLGRAPRCRGQGVAWLTPAPLARLAERHHPGAAERRRPEPQAAGCRDRLGPTSRPVREPGAPPEGAMVADTRLRLITHLTGDGAQRIGRTQGHSQQRRSPEDCPTPGARGHRDHPPSPHPVQNASVRWSSARGASYGVDASVPETVGSSASTGTAGAIPTTVGVGCSFTSSRKTSGRA